MGYSAALDGLRACAILLVLGYHLRLVPGGALGVDVFFVISGFLITSILLSEWRLRGAISLKRFYLRRALRLLPAFLLCVGFIFAIQTTLIPVRARTFTTGALVSSLLYVFNWFILSAHNVFRPATHFWSLAVEEQFYLLWPIILVLLLKLKRSPRQLATLTLLAAFAASAWRAWLYDPNDDYWILRCYFGTDTRSDGLLLGAALALARDAGLPQLKARVVSLLTILSITIIGVTVLLCAPLDKGIHADALYYGQFTVFALASAFLLAVAVDRRLGLLHRILTTRVLVWIGRISYSLYLFHFPVIEYGNKFVRTTHPHALSLLLVAVSFAVSALSYYAVERPILRLKDRWAP